MNDDLPEYYQTREARREREPDNVYGIGEDDHEKEVTESLHENE